jgi:hypothetical protein
MTGNEIYYGKPESEIWEEIDAIIMNRDWIWEEAENRRRERLEWEQRQEGKIGQ